MRALQVSALSADLSGCEVVDVPTPTPGPGEVLVQVEAATIGFPDLLMTRGGYQMRPELPFIPGGEVSGRVAMLGPGVEGLKLGDEVTALRHCGGMAEFATYPLSDVRAKPARLSHGQAAALGAAYLTAHVALTAGARLEAGQWLLVHGAAGGVGLAAVDLGRVLGARVIAASASDRKLGVIAQEYAPDALVNTSAGFKDDVNALTGGQGADVVYDPVGGDVFAESLRCIAFGGRLAVVGFASGQIPTLSVNRALIKGVSIVGVRAGEFTRRFPEEGRRRMDEICAFAEQGWIRPRVHAELPLSRWREAFAMMSSRELVGRVILHPGA